MKTIYVGILPCGTPYNVHVIYDNNKNTIANL